MSPIEIETIREKNARTADEYISQMLSTPGTLHCASCDLPIKESADPNAHRRPPACSLCYEMVAPLYQKPYWLELMHQKQLERRRILEGS